jgi:hypothetical protein
VAGAGPWPGIGGEVTPAGRCELGVSVPLRVRAKGVVSPLDMGRGSMSCGRAPPWCKGLKLEMVDEMPGLLLLLCWLGRVGDVTDVSLVADWSWSASTTSRITPSTRRTMLPTAISLGWAATSRRPTLRMRVMRAWASRVRSAATIRSSSCVVARAHGREFLIWRRWRSETKSSMELSMSFDLSVLRNVESEGAWPEIVDGMIAGVCVVYVLYCRGLVYFVPH